MEPVSKKERFDLCLGMLKGYYDGLEGRLDKSLALLVAVVGWILAFDKVRMALRTEPSMFWLAQGTLGLIVAFYCLNVLHWLGRWREIQGYADGLAYVDHEYYTRYRLHGLALPGYLVPVLVLYAFVVVTLILIRTSQ